MKFSMTEEGKKLISQFEKHTDDYISTDDFLEEIINEAYARGKEEVQVKILEEIINLIDEYGYQQNYPEGCEKILLELKEKLAEKKKEELMQ